METIKIKADTDLTAEVMNFMDAELLRNSFPVDLQPEILIAVEEIFVNIASYAYKPAQDGYVELFVEIGEKAVIRFEDTGLPFNPLDGDEPDLNTSIMEREIGGLGIHFVKNMMDEVEYVYADGKNILTITKAVSKQDRVN
ncbi:MAG: ATP-binding protein [Oscillospiraceae bacterium]|nr:ATP-binding protein [Oscillospiraceae bacterium]